MTKMSWLLFLLLLTLSSCSQQNNSRIETVFPEDEWSRSTPNSVEVDSTQLIRAIDYLRSKCFEDGVDELLVARHGKVIYEGDRTSKIHNIYSCSKAFTSMVMGLLDHEGKINIDDPAAKYDSSLTALYPEVTFRHFATMTSGYSAQGRSRWEDENSDWSLTPYVPEEPHFSPGSHYEYWDEAQMMYGKVLTEVLGEPMKDFLAREVMSKIGINDWNWYPEGETSSGIPINNGCTNVMLNARQLARVGLLFLQEGRWENEQVLPSDFVRKATTNQVDSSLPVFNGDRSNVKGSGSYGFNWWVNSADGLSRMPDAPLGVAYLSGLNHNVCCIVPEWDMVIVRMGDDKNPLEGKHVVWNKFLFDLSKAIL